MSWGGLRLFLGKDARSQQVGTQYRWVHLAFFSPPYSRILSQSCLALQAEFLR